MRNLCPLDTIIMPPMEGIDQQNSSLTLLELLSQVKIPGTKKRLLISVVPHGLEKGTVFLSG
jgi:hypothetical protein